ncbi:ATP-binding protein [Streptomyces sp. Je 1-79]|uniref:ATP-binding protein n=1 Tax=Streptomyces sp. Je 1-79 TaxID=2943847 RepID=UPI0021A8E992|nr:ATP-binding protein [Streptomyces sp. Je 1-79]MCT4351520.1 ATP-binding protein [Streptomyces sp. Je 1-79]
MTDSTATQSATRRPSLSASVDYDIDDGVIASARDFIADFLSASPAVGREPVARERIDLARLVVSELVTNVVRHAPGPCRVLLELFDEALEISVFDRREASPVPRGHDPGRIGQHGVEIVVAVCESVSVEPLPSGKRVRARLSLA